MDLSIASESETFIPSRLKSDVHTMAPFRIGVLGTALIVLSLAAASRAHAISTLAGF